MSQPTENDPALEDAKDAYREALDVPPGEEPVAPRQPSTPVPNPDEDEVTGIAPE